MRQYERFNSISRRKNASAYENNKIAANTLILHMVTFSKKLDMIEMKNKSFVGYCDLASFQNVNLENEKL